MDIDVFVIDLFPACPRCDGPMLDLHVIVWPEPMIYFCCANCGKLLAVGPGERPPEENLENWGRLLADGVLTA